MILYPQEVKEMLEALLLCSAEPLTLGALSDITGYESADILDVLDQLQQDYLAQGRGFEICEIAGGWMFATMPKHAPYIEKLVKPRLVSLSQASLEVLSIIAYRQPITRGEMEEIRGVNCDSSVNTLLERGLITEAGRKDVPGRPILFATTTAFLKYFGLTSIKDLPEMDMSGFQPVNPEEFDLGGIDGNRVTAAVMEDGEGEKVSEGAEAGEDTGSNEVVAAREDIVDEESHVVLEAVEDADVTRSIEVVEDATIAEPNEELSSTDSE